MSHAVASMAHARMLLPTGGSAASAEHVPRSAAAVAETQHGLQAHEAALKVSG